MNAALEQEIRYRLLKLLSNKGTLSQREMARQIGISLGKMNLFLSELSRKGLLLVQQSRVQGKKMKYLYLLTSAGLEEKGRLALDFLKAKMSEHEKLRNQIRELVDEVGENGAEADFIGRESNSKPNR